jgi:hypothetical protein
MPAMAAALGALSCLWIRESWFILVSTDEETRWFAIFLLAFLFKVLLAARLAQS